MILFYIDKTEYLKCRYLKFLTKPHPMKTVLKINLLIIYLLLVNACKRDADILPAKIDKDPSVKLILNYKVDGAALIFDSLMYTNNAGNNYEVSRLEYYISNITFH